MSDTTISRRTLAKGVAWTAPAIAVAASAPRLAASTTALGECYVFDMWSPNGRQPINNNRDQISGTVRYSPNNYQSCAEPNTPYPHPFTITITLDPQHYTGKYEYSGQGSAVQTGSSIAITFPANLNQGNSHQWNLYATTRDGVTPGTVKHSVHVEATSFPEVEWKIIEPHNEWMGGRTASSYDY